MTDDLSIEERDALILKGMMNKTAYEVNLILEGHERTIHGGETCLEERVNLVAFLAHRVGIRDRESLWMLIKRIEAYEDYHHEHHPEVP
jgi:hypothetical protein